MREWWNQLPRRRRRLLVVTSILVAAVVIGSTAGGGSDNSKPVSSPSPSRSADDVSPVDPEQGYVSRDLLGDAWPLSVEDGVLECDAFAVTFTSNGQRYAVNGTARSAKRWTEIDEIWLDNPHLEGTKINIGPLLDRGLALCD